MGSAQSHPEDTSPEKTMTESSAIKLTRSPASITLENLGADTLDWVDVATSVTEEVLKDQAVLVIVTYPEFELDSSDFQRNFISRVGSCDQGSYYLAYSDDWSEQDISRLMEHSEFVDNSLWFHPLRGSEIQLSTYDPTAILKTIGDISLGRPVDGGNQELIGTIADGNVWYWNQPHEPAVELFGRKLKSACGQNKIGLTVAS